MKKILSTLVMCLIFGVGYSYGITVTAKAVVYDQTKSNSERVQGGGNVIVYVANKYNGGWIAYWESWTDGTPAGTDTYSTWIGNPMSGGDKNGQVCYSASVENTSNGYFFYQWEETNGGKITEKGGWNNDRDIKDTEISSDKTVYAVFKPVTVDNYHNGTISVTDITPATLEGTVTFNVTGADNANDFHTPIVSGEGFAYKSMSYANNVITVTVTYTVQDKDNVNGDLKPNYSATVTLRSKGDADGTLAKQATITATESLIPAFSIPATLNLTPDAPALTTEPAQQSFTIEKNNQVAANASWEATLPQVAKDLGFSVETSTTTVTVKFTPKDNDYQEDIPATLSITGTYIDSNGKIITNTQSVSLSADKGSAVKIDGTTTASYDFGTKEYTGQAYTHDLSYATNLTTGLTHSWVNGNFMHAISSGTITITLPTTSIPGDYSDKLSVKYGDTEVASLTASAKVRLAQPQIESKVYMSQILLTWKNVYGAKQYILKSDETVIDISDVMTSEAIATASTSDSHTLSYSKMITAIGDVPLSTGTEYPFTLTVVYGDDVNNINDVTKISSTTITATPTATTTITAGDVPLLGIYTGTEKAGAYPHHKDGKRLVDLSAAFKDNVAAFDQLFVFGLTTGDANNNITTADATTGSNASTPCYIYVKDGNNYKLSSTIPNVNVADKPQQFNITELSKSYYFTGYSPYTSCGYQWEKDKGLLEANGEFVNGVFFFSGEGNVNLYLDNLQLYARPKSQNGSTTVTEKEFSVTSIEDATILFRDDVDGNISEGINVNFYTQGSGSVFCFQPERNGSTLQPNIHLKGNNIIESTQGVYLRVIVNYLGISLDRGAVQHSAPIQILHNKKTIGTATELTIDDLWNSERTNGILNLATQDSRPAPTIDLGLSNTTLNINGGQLFLSNSFNTSDAYDVSYAISYRSKSMMDVAHIYGLGDDQPGATVIFNDGTINCKPLRQTDFESDKGQKLFHNATSMKCPQNTFIRGGSFNCDVLACSSTTSKGASPKNAENGDNLCMVTIPIESVNSTNGTANLQSTWQTDVVTLGLAKPESEIIYSDANKSYDYYGISSMTPQTITGENGDEIQVVHLMLPSDQICFKEIITTAWATCFPTVSVSVAAGETVDLGGNVEVVSQMSLDDGLTKVEKTSKLLYGEIDQYMINLLNGVTVDEEEFYYVAQDGEISTSLVDNGISMSVTNTESYAIYDKIYMVMPLVANQWEMFVPPFDVANVYVIEPYTEANLIKAYDENGDGKLTNAEGQHEIHKARYAQANRTMNFFQQWLWYVKVMGSDDDLWSNDSQYPAMGHLDSFGAFGRDWVKGYSGLADAPTVKDCIQQLYHYHPTATYPSGKYWWDANFYLYQAVGDTWTYENGELQVNWEEVPTISQPRNIAGKHNVIMKKGQVYVMSFPSTIVNNELYDYVNTWDYWTGKYIIIEGYPEEDVDTDGDDEPDDKAQMISGSEVDWQGNNISNTILAPYAADNSASLRGNSTFAKLDVSKIKNAFVLNNYLRGKNASDDTDQDFGYGLVNSEYAHNVYVNLWESGFDAEYEDPIHLSPGQGFILANFTAPMSMRAKAINLQSGEIAFGNEDSSQGTTTGVPTILGNNQMMVYNIEGGVGIVPVVAQQVSIYNAAGQLVTSQYLTDEVHIPLPTGIYLIAGAKDQFKAVVK